MKKYHPGTALCATPIALAIMLLAGCGSNGSDDPPVQIKTLSTRADLVTDGDAMVEIVLPSGAQADGLKVEVGGRDVTSAFALRDGRLTGLVTGLAAGENTLVASSRGASAAELKITNTGRGGPIISGPQTVPYVCATPTPQAANGTQPATHASGLGTAAVDAQCNIATEYKLYYKTTAANCSFALPDPTPNVPFDATTPPAAATPPANPCFKPYTVGSTPADLATTTTDNGASVPYIVRVERGTMNRGIYDIAVLFDPAKPWTPVAPQAQWNGKVLYQFGASTGQPRRQFRPATAWTDDKSLSRGFMVVANSLTDSLQNSNRVMMTETVMMMKEHISDSYGSIKYTMGSGCSGGSINANMNASIAPGLLDGMTISCAYPDSESTLLEVNDCVLLVEAYQKPAWLNLMTNAGLTPAQANAKKAAINGHRDQTGCHAWYNRFGTNAQVGNYFTRTVVDNTTGAISQASTLTNNCQLPTSQVFDKTSNPNGARCSAWDWATSIWGKSGDGNRSRETRDNTGVQYGLKALMDGAISGEEFVTLNEIIGGVDKDSQLVAARSQADTTALDIAYKAGIVMSGQQLAKTAVIDMRGYDDSLIDVPPGITAFPQALVGIHHQWRSFSIRDRLDKANGNHDNQVIWRFGRSGFTPSTAMATSAFLTMDEWLTKLKADSSSSTIQQKLKAAKPAGASDYCVLSSDAAQATKVTDTAACDADPYLRKAASPRQVAGGPLTEDVLKCQLKPVNVADYNGLLNAAQLSRLQAVFTTGVCDWSKPGVGQQPAVSWLTFAAGPGGQPMPAEPVSRAR
ncbi:DUF6351 family protein [uncultured Aquincola sp.]|uniref:DUF6351 family protein n=1 Tax=uncultured Aquincola sp. TaxID=886556 RepID=UPI0032B14F36